MDLSMVMVSIFGLIELVIKANGIIMNFMAMVNINGQTAGNILVNGKLVK